MSSGPQGRGCLGGGATDGHVLARGGAGRPRVSWRLTSLCGRLQTARTAASQLPRLSRVVVGVASAAAAAATAMAQYKGAASEAGRAMHLMKKREKQREQMEQMKQRIAEVRTRPGSLETCALPTARTPWAPACPRAAGVEHRRRAGAGPLLPDLQQEAETSRRV